MRIVKGRKKIIFSYKKSLLLISILFFFSGASGLIYQTVWVRLLEIFFGVTLVAITLIVSAYMTGLGIGSLIGGRIARKGRNNVYLFGIAQIIIGLFGVLSPSLIDITGKYTAGSPYILVFLVSFLLLLIPTTLMGMTLPFLVQAFIQKTNKSGETIGILYGINTLGAAFGALISGYLLIGWFALSGALNAAIIINVLVGIGAIYLNRLKFIQEETNLPQSSDHSMEKSSTWNFEAILISSFLVGFIGMGFEMLWVRLLGIIGKHTAYTFPSILFIYLIAYAFGGWVFGKKSDISNDPVRMFWKLQITIGIVTALCFLIAWIFLNLPQFQPILRRNFSNIQQAIPLPTYVSALKDKITEVLVFSKKVFFFEVIKYFAPILLLVFPAAFFMGGSLPILDRISIEKAENSGRRVGDIHLSNIIGSVLGTLLTSFIFLPYLGSELTQKLLSLLTIVFFLLVVFSKRTLQIRSQVILPISLIFLVFLLPGKGQFYTRFYQVITNNQNIKIKESGDSILSLTFNQDSKKASGLWIGGLQNSYFPSTGEYERIALTCAAGVQPKRILVIGFGGGNTANFFASLPNIDEIVIVELLEDLDSFLSENIPFVDTLLSNSKVNYIIDDGRRYLYANPNERYDLIFIDPMWSYQAGHNNLYSEEAMRLYKSHLSEGGIFCAWVNEGHFIPKTAASVFNYSDFFSDFLVNSESPIEYNMNYMSSVYQKYISSLSINVAERSLKILEPEKIISGKVSGKTLTLKNDSVVPLLTDMNPWLEYFFICPDKFLEKLNIYQLKYCSQKF